MGTVGNNFDSDLRKCPIVCDCALKSASDESDVYDANGDRTEPRRIARKRAKPSRTTNCCSTGRTTTSTTRRETASRSSSIGRGPTSRAAPFRRRSKHNPLYLGLSGPLDAGNDGIDLRDENRSRGLHVQITPTGRPAASITFMAIVRRRAVRRRRRSTTARTPTLRSASPLARNQASVGQLRTTVSSVPLRQGRRSGPGHG